MEWNKKNIFRIFFPPLVWEFKWEEMEWLGGNVHSSLFPQNLKFLFPPKLGGMRGNGFRFNEIFVEILKIPL